MRKMWLGSTLALTLLAAPAWADPQQAANPDPWEGFNRHVFKFNDRLDTHVLKPAASFYLRVTPHFIVDGISNFFSNLGEPVTVVNQLLQGKVRNAVSDTGRFVLNSTVGVLGLFDVASHASIPHHNEDFGQTLGVWGVGPGPYLVLPLLGPSTVRDVTGRGVDFFDNPVTDRMTLTTSIVLHAADSFNERAALIPLEGIVQGDKYLFVRDLYLQHRDFEIKDGKVDDPFLDDSGSDDSSSDAPAAPAGSGAQLAPADDGSAGKAASPAGNPAPTAGSGDFVQ